MDDGKHAFSVIGVEISTLGAKQEGESEGEDGAVRWSEVVDDGKHVFSVIGVEISTLGAKQEGEFGGEDGAGRFGRVVDYLQGR